VRRRPALRQLERARARDPVLLAELKITLAQLEALLVTWLLKVGEPWPR
jgi:hypothetical protein